MKTILTSIATALGLALTTPQAMALSPETALLLKLLQDKGIITESESAGLAESLQPLTDQTAATADTHHHSVQSQEDRTENLKPEAAQEQFGNRLRLNGLIEIEARASKTKTPGQKNTTNSALTLATAQLNANAMITQEIHGHLALLYEESPDSDAITVDEALIVIQPEASPFFATIGRHYLPFGHFESHFIADPTTLALGETNDIALVAGYRHGILEARVGGFSGAIKEQERTSINSFVSSLTVTSPEQNGQGTALTCGVSYLSNLAASNSLAEAARDDPINSPAGGVSVFTSLAINEQFFFDAEYLGAVEHFNANDFAADHGEILRPESWNFEAAARINERTELAVRYGGSKETGVLLPGKEYGAAILYTIFDSTNVTIEYLMQTYRDSRENSQGTIQLAVEW